MFASLLHAATVTVSITELDTALQTTGGESDALKRIVLEKIQARLDDAGLILDEGELLFEETLHDVESVSSCNRTEILELTTKVALSGDTQLALTVDSLYDPVTIDLNVYADIDARGRARQVVGARLGRCQVLGTDSFSFSANGPVNLNVHVALELNPELNRETQQLVLRPAISLSAELSHRDITVDVDDTWLRRVLEKVLEEQIDRALSSSRLAAEISKLQARIDTALQEELDNGLIVVELPDPNDEQVLALYELLSPDADFLLSIGYVHTHRQELLAALILGDDAMVDSILGNAAMCEASGLLQVPLLHAPVYEIGAEGCNEAQIPAGEEAATAALYVDASCQHAFDFSHTSAVDYCNTVLDTQRLGNAASNPENLGQWTLSPGTTFDIGALPLTGLRQPYTQRVRYKQVATPMGECELEMRVHVPQADTSQTNNRALIAFHGGSWQHRLSGSLGIETMATQFVDAGYVVFAPFYRLAGISQGNPECNGASLDDIMEDANDAMDWVNANAADYGAFGKPVVFGQSAGGHLAAALAVSRPTEVASAVLFYAPTDFSDYVQEIRDGQHDSITGQRILETLLGESIDTLDIDAPVIQRNSFPDRIAENPGVVPPVFMLHGKNDTLLPYRQSVRLCNAL
ncbi:MAG: alpha/beta hydrolase, partial [Granulosicoccus sp.]